jgi:hypothetical protein
MKKKFHQAISLTFFSIKKKTGDGDAISYNTFRFANQIYDRS